MIQILTTEKINIMNINVVLGKGQNDTDKNMMKMDTM